MDWEESTIRGNAGCPYERADRLMGFGLSHGAVTVVNAIPAGRGAAIGVNLTFEAEVHLKTGGGVVQIKNGMRRKDNFVALCVKKVFDMLDVRSGAEVKTRSAIPPRKGLKSSSACANAVIQAA